jgi:hypothetical protein
VPSGSASSGSGVGRSCLAAARHCGHTRRGKVQWECRPRRRWLRVRFLLHCHLSCKYVAGSSIVVLLPSSDHPKYAKQCIKHPACMASRHHGSWDRGTETTLSGQERKAQERGGCQRHQRRTSLPELGSMCRQRRRWVRRGRLSCCCCCRLRLEWSVTVSA